MILTRSITLSPSTPLAARFPRVGYKNLFREGTVSASTENPDHPVALAYDGLTYDGWQPESGGEQWIAVELDSAADADYMAVAAHTLGGASLIPQYSDDGGATWIDLADEFMPDSNAPIVWEFETVFASRYRLLINSIDAVSIGAIHVGERLTFPRGFPVGWTPPSLNEKTEYSNTMSEGGHTLGRHVTRRGAMADGVAQQVTMTWARETWMDFIAVAENYAFFFWRTLMEENEIVYGSMTSGCTWRSR